MATTPNRGYLIVDPTESIFPQIRDFQMAVDADVEIVADAVDAIVSSQWTTNGSNIHYDAGNVGIGNTAPVDKLEVGNALATTYITVRGPLNTVGGLAGLKLLEGTGAAGFEIQYQGDNNRLSFLSDNAGGARNERLVIDRDTGNVGVNIALPLTKFHVDTGGTEAGAFRLSGTGGVRIDLYSTNTNAGARNWAARIDNVVFGDFAIYQSSAKDGNPFSAGVPHLYFDNAGKAGFGTITPGAKLHVLSTTEQFRLSYDPTNYASLTVGSGGNLTIAPTGDLIFDPTGNDILPAVSYDLNIGALGNKFLTLHAAELWVETLVAQDTLATIGGRILVGPTTTLIEDLPAGDSPIKVKHNNLANGDRVYMESNGKVEFVAVTSGPTTITGGYSYTVTRDLDGSGSNLFYAGDAVFNTGTTGSGFIDLYSLRGVKAGTEVGPTIVGNVRNSSTFNDWSAHWAIGNLNGLYGYGATTFGVAFGKYAAGTPHITIDATNGYRIFSGLSTIVAQWNNAGDIIIGEVAAAKSNTLISAGAFSIRLNTTNLFNVDTSGNVTLGTVATDQGNAYWNNTTKTLQFRGGTSGTVVQAYVDTSGRIMAGGGNIALGANGMQVIAGDAYSATRAHSNVISVDGTELSAFYEIYSVGAARHETYLVSRRVTGKGTYLALLSEAITGEVATLDMMVTVNSVLKGRLLLNSTAGLAITADGFQDHFTISPSGVFQIWDGTALKTVSFGANDSAGAGFRTVRIPN